MKTVREACEHGRYERHVVGSFIPMCDPWDEGKNTLQLRGEDDFFGGKRWKERWVSEWEPTDE